MQPQSISEQMMFNTVRLVTDSGCGTGSYFNFRIGDATVPVIITNKHVVNNNCREKTIFFFTQRVLTEIQIKIYKLLIKQIGCFTQTKIFAFAI